MTEESREFAYGFHTQKKAKLVGIWYKICIDVEKFKRRFNIVDLYAGDGLARHRTPDGISEEWGPPLRAVSMIRESRANNIRCAFNDINPAKIQRLQENLCKCIDGYDKERYIINFYNEDANRVYKEVLQRIEAEDHNLFFLDPRNHGQLEWSTIEGIASFSVCDYYKDQAFVRRPELLVNFMTYTMQKNYKTSERVREEIDRSLGVCREAWMKKVEKYERRGIPIYQAFLDIFLDRLSKYYDKKDSILPFPVTSVQSEGPIYFLILASTHPMAHKITFTKFGKYIEREFREVDYEYRRQLARLREGKLLSEYFDCGEN